MVVALVHSRLDYGNGVLVGIPAHLMRQLQSILNAAARLIFNLKRSDHITDALVSLHWLRVLERIQYKIAVLSCKVLHDTAPWYLGPLTRVADIPGHSFNTHFVCDIFQFICVLFTVVGPLLLNASLLLVLTTDYSDWLVHLTELTDNDRSFWLIIHSFSINFPGVKIFNGVNFLITNDIFNALILHPNNYLLFSYIYIWNCFWEIAVVIRGLFLATPCIFGWTGRHTWWQRTGRAALCLLWRVTW